MKKTLSLTYTALCTAIIAVCSQICIPLPSGVPLTLQTFAVAFTGFILGKKRGVAAVAIYILLGAFGIPVFSGFRGGLSVITGITGGFLTGFIFTAYLCGIICNIKNTKLKFIISIFAIFPVHISGCIQFSLITNSTIIYSFITTSAPFLLKDILTVLLALIIYDRISPYLKFKNFK
ncbi:MAG: biotin transporter BioY [Oscillospiraceae bacterium]|nr:biotin transporter BioY [Oscillospiraceae bacterium]